MPHVMLNTIVRNTYLGNKSSSNVTTGATAQVRNLTTTRPATDVSTTTATRGSIVFGSTSNYMKIHPWASGGTPLSASSAGPCAVIPATGSHT